MTDRERDFWGSTPQHTIDFANEQCRKNRIRIEKEKRESLNPSQTGIPVTVTELYTP